MFDNRLKRLRESRNLTQKEAAIELEIAQRTYSSYENNEREPNSEILKKLSLYYGVTVDYLLGIEKVNSDNLSGQEFQHIKKYRILDEYGTKAVDTLLDIEYERCISASYDNNIKYVMKAARGGDPPGKYEITEEEIKELEKATKIDPEDM